MITNDYREENGIKLFHEDIEITHADYNAKSLDNLFSAENKHFWFLARKEYIYQNMNKIIDHRSRMIEIGAGTGNVSRYLKSKGYSNISVGEMHCNGLKYAKSYGIEECYQFDLLRSPFADEFNAVCMFDVLEHIEEDKKALQNANKMLKDNGHIILTVPAHMWLWNRADKTAGHKHRYNRSELVAKLEAAGFEIVKAKYFFISIVPLLLLRRFVNKDNNMLVKKEERSKDIVINNSINKILLTVSRIENKVSKFSPNFFGGSLFVVAKKQ